MTIDRRTKRQKLEAMANQSSSPLEAEIARKKLKELKEEEPKPLDTRVANVSTWIDYNRGKVITKITFADGRVEIKELDLFTSGFSFTTQSFTASYKK